MPRPLPVLVVVLAFVALFVSPAFPGSARAADDDGVHVDPNSPPATEYALPLEAARRAAAGDSGAGASGAGAGASGTGSGTGGTPPPPAFGSGITPKPAAGSGPRSRARPGGPSQSGGAASPTPQPPPGADTPARIADTSAAPILYSVGGALAVLAAGGLLAAMLRRRQTPA